MFLQVKTFKSVPAKPLSLLSYFFPIYLPRKDIVYRIFYIKLWFKFFWTEVLALFTCTNFGFQVKYIFFVQQFCSIWICLLFVCLFVLTDAQERQIDIATLGRERPIGWDIAHVQNNFMISTRLCSCTSLPGIRGGTWEGRKLQKGEELKNT